MKRLIILLVLLSLACALPGVLATPEPSPTPSATPASPTPPPATWSVQATGTPVIAPRPTYTPTPEPKPTATVEPDPRLDPDEVLFLPQPLFEGDRLSVDVDPFLPPASAWEEGEAPTVTLVLPDGETTSSAVALLGLDNVAQARFYWVDDVPPASGNGPGSASGEDPPAQATAIYTLTLDLPADLPDPNLENNTLVLRMPVRPRESLPPPEPGAAWAVTETTGFSVHYITGSAAERDLLSIMEQATQAYTDVQRRLDDMGASPGPAEPVEIYLLDRVVGQGGYASPDWVAVTYTDRAYSPVSLDLVLRHELTHRLDSAIGCDGAPPILREGLAVVFAGGHYRRESLREKAAALYGTTHYIPLPELADGFYTHQHEVGYLEAAAVLSYLIDRWGWEVVPRVCRAASSDNGDEAARWEAALEAIGIAGSVELERLWHAWLQGSNVVLQDARLLELELQLMDTMRQYQATYDPAAHFLEGILFSPAEAQQRGIVANFVRRPRDPTAVTLELLLAMGQDALVKRDPILLEMLRSTLASALVEGVAATDFTSAVHSVTQKALARGWEPYRLILEADGRIRVYVLSWAAWPQRSVLLARRQGETWELSGAVWSD